MKVVNVQGRKKTGKTTTVTNIIAELCRRGYSVGSIKGIHIDGFTMDVEGEDTGKHKKAGANPVTARCHDETNIMFRDKMNLREILKHYDNDWVVIESHVDLNCPNIITGRTAEYSGEGKDESLAEQINDLTIACSGVISNELHEYKGLPVINSVTDIESLVDVIEDSYAKAAKSETTSIKAPDAEFSLVEENHYTRIFSDGTTEKSCDTMMLESTIDIYVNSCRAGSIPCTPEYLVELIIGWANAEGFINGIDDLESINISENGNRADIAISNEYENFNECNCCPNNKLKTVNAIPWKKEWIFSLAEDFERGLPLREKTMAAHNCRLARGNGDGSVDILFKCEDIGRHSAIDKTVGWALRNGIELSECIMFSSGRISRAMVKKAVMAGIPVMAGKGTISGKAVELARECGLTLIGYGKTDSLCIFTESGK